MEIRYHKLDAIRGVAALIVLINHFYNLVPGWNWHNLVLDYTPISHIVNGRTAVVVFFVLSGFVLTVPITRGRSAPYFQFVLKRVVRIYIPFVVAIFLAAGLASALSFPKPSWALNIHDWGTPITANLIVSHLAMLGVDYKSISIDPPMWTLIQEMRFSLIFPLLAVIVVRFSWKAILPIILISLISTKTDVLIGESFGDKVSHSLLSSTMLTLYYIYFFAIGVFIASSLSKILATFKLVPFKYHLIILSIFLLVPRAFIEHSFLLGDFLHALFAAYIIILCILFDDKFKVLDGQVLSWLGKVSYSLYLTHLPVLMALLFLLHDRISILLILLLALPICFFVAELFYRVVEYPSIQIGKMIGRKPMNITKIKELN